MKKFLLSLICLIFMAATAGAETYTHTFSKGELTTDGGTVTLSNIEWTSSTATYIDWNATKGIQIGSKNNPNESYTLSTSGFAGCTIKSITVNSSIANSCDAKITITAGNQTSEAFTPGTSDAAYTFDCDDRAEPDGCDVRGCEDHGVEKDLEPGPSARISPEGHLPGCDHGAARREPLPHGP